jgi:hypothetical protein
MEIRAMADRQTAAGIPFERNASKPSLPATNAKRLRKGALGDEAIQRMKRTGLLRLRSQ